MTRPEEPTEALPTHALPTDPPRDEPTVHLVPPRPSVDAEATAPLTAGRASEPTVHLARPTAGAATTGHLTGPVGAEKNKPSRAGATEPTAHLGPPGQPGGQPTVAYRSTGAGPTVPGATVGAYREPTAQAVNGGFGPAPGGELRFGPGVPATPPPAPAWPVAPPARPPRPVWRRFVSVLSTVLTAALLVVVGLYLWQRLRPLEIEQVSVAVPRPAGVACDVTVDVVATVRTNGRAGTIRYQWFRSDAPPGALLSERVGSGQRTTMLTLKWTFSGVGATTGTATVNIVEPSPVQAGTRVSYRCPGG
ncbi:hypothetical protein [Micromonospora sp. WMMD975]|uniref:hypothetical protein n=1 Tax=Micromonospora sp. WMMD975 TaxID=3016087 RepID=UPI00249ADA93|nr:hypothetical protein [Micromonospora sp. WMMD975]WFE35793.1 hypothetical protein O7613_10575 [Micromonospora sp. WMMD975]